MHIRFTVEIDVESELKDGETAADVVKMHSEDLEDECRRAAMTSIIFDSIPGMDCNKILKIEAVPEGVYDENGPNIRFTVEMDVELDPADGETEAEMVKDIADTIGADSPGTPSPENYFGGLPNKMIAHKVLKVEAISE